MRLSWRRWRRRAGGEAEGVWVSADALTDLAGAPGMSRPLLVNLGVKAVTVAVLMLATFAYAMRTRVHAIMDTVWRLGFVLIALVSFLLSTGYRLAARLLALARSKGLHTPTT